MYQSSDIELKLMDDSFQTEHWLIDIPCTGPELFQSR